MTTLITATRALKSTLGCRISRIKAASSSQTLLREGNLAVAVLDPEDTEKALQWYRERFGIDADGALIDGRLRIRQENAATPGPADF